MATSVLYCEVVDDLRYSLMELSEATGVEARTIRNYIENGLLQGPSSMGRGAKYGEEDRQRLLVIRDLRERERLTLKEIRHRLALLSTREIDLAASAQGEPKGRVKSALEYVNAVLSPAPNALQRRGGPKVETWLHLEVTPDLELVWKGPSSSFHVSQLERIAERIRMELLSRKGSEG